MKKRLVLFIIGSLAVVTLFTLGVSLGLAQQGTGGRGEGQPEEVTARSSYIPIQGQLTNADGHPLDGDYVVSYRIYDVPSGGTALCEDLTNALVVEDGLFIDYMNLAGCSAIDGRQLYLGIQVEPDAEMSPRTYIDNVPYAVTSASRCADKDSLNSNAILHIENAAETGRGLRAYAMAESGVNYGIVGASRSPDGYGGYFYNNGGGVGLLASSDDGTALDATSVESIAVSVPRRGCLQHQWHCHQRQQRQHVWPVGGKPDRHGHPWRRRQWSWGRRVQPAGSWSFRRKHVRASH